MLNGSKIWITNGGSADVFTVFARTSALEEGAKPRITAFIVERGMGVKSGPNERKLGIRGSSTTEIFLEDVKVPVENVLGEVGRGFKVAMEVLNNGRLGLASGCVGLATRLIKLAIERVQERRAFGRNIGEFGLIKDKIATMLAETYALESMTYLTAGIVDGKVADYSLESAICKIMGSETVWRVANEALQIAAGIGYMADYPYERLLRDARINLIFEGTNEILRCFVALSGMQGPGRGARRRGEGDARADQGLRPAQRLRRAQGAHRPRPRADDPRAPAALARGGHLRGAHRRAGDRRGERAPQARARDRRDAVHAEAHRGHGHRSLRRSPPASRAPPAPSSAAARTARDARST